MTENFEIIQRMHFAKHSCIKWEDTTKTDLEPSGMGAHGLD
jgi:hypothetical protein